MDFGSHLRDAREASGLTLRDISKSTKISLLVLEALERNDFSRLPGGIFTRAFIRSYALHVGLNPEQTLEMFLAAQPTEAVSAAQVHHVADEEDFESQRQVASLALGFGVVSLVLLAIFFFVSRGGGDRDADRESAAQPAVARPAPVIEETAPTSGAGQPPEPETQQPAGFLLTLHPVGPCWATISADGRQTLRRLVQPGERVELRASEGVDLRLGDAAACTFSLNGVPARALGQAGRVVQVRIDPSNYRNFFPD